MSSIFTTSQELNVKAFSAGYETHKRNHADYRVYFEVNGTMIQPVVADHGRGWNLVVVDPTTENVLLSNRYDTYLNQRQAVTDLEVALQSIPVGAIVALAIMDTGDYNSNSEWGRKLAAALRSCGGTGREISFRESYAMIGRKGTEVGSATENYDAEGYPVSITYSILSEIPISLTMPPSIGDDIIVTCVVCMNNTKNMMINPCNHVCLCEECCVNLTECPICRGRVGIIVKVYL